MDTPSTKAVITKAALITGGAKRIGASIALRLARDGWHVVLHYSRSAEAARQLEAEIEGSGGTASVVAGDLAAPGRPAAVVDEAFRLAPGLELLVNNASALTHDTLATTSAGALEVAFAINAGAPILLSQAFAARLPADTKGAIVNIVDNRVFAPNPDYFAFGISKFALLGATRMMALALAPRIRVNGIAPGITLVSGEQTEENFATAHSRNPLQRGCSPEEIAAAVAFIASSPAMTGTIITIDGGQALANPGRDVAFLDAGTDTGRPGTEHAGPPAPGETSTRS